MGNVECNTAFTNRVQNLKVISPLIPPDQYYVGLELNTSEGVFIVSDIHESGKITLISK